MRLGSVYFTWNGLLRKFHYLIMTKWFFGCVLSCPCIVRKALYVSSELSHNYSYLGEKKNYVLSTCTFNRQIIVNLNPRSIIHTPHELSLDAKPQRLYFTNAKLITFTMSPLFRMIDTMYPEVHGIRPYKILVHSPCSVTLLFYRRV